MSSNRAAPSPYGGSGPPNQSMQPLPGRVGPPGGVGIGNMAPQGMGPPPGGPPPGMGAPPPPGMGMRPPMGGPMPQGVPPQGMPAQPAMPPQQMQQMAQAQALRGGPRR